MLGRIRISSRLAAGFAVILLLLSILAGVSVVSLNADEQGVKAVAHKLENSGASLLALKEAALARGYLWAEIASGDGRFSVKAGEFFAKAHQRLKDLDDSSEQAERNGDVVALDHKIAAYEAAMATFIAIGPDRFTTAEGKAAYDAAFVVLTDLDKAGKQVAEDFALRSKEQEQDTIRYSNHAVTFAITIAVISLALGIGLAFAISRSIVNPLNDILTAVDRLGAGDTAITIKGTDRTDEFGPLAMALDKWRTSLIAEQGHRETERKQMVEREQHTLRLDGLIKDFDTDVGGVLDAVSSNSTRLNSTAQVLSSNSQEAAGHATLVAETAQVAAGSV